MISSIFNQVFFLPLYNALVWLSSILPGNDIGLAIITLTILVKIGLFPLQHRVNKTQKTLKRLEPQLQELKLKYAENRPEQAKQLMALYQEHGVNPFAGFIVLLIQIPILLALFWVFKDSFLIKTAWLYPFVTAPAVPGTHLFGLLDITTSSYLLALLVGLTQFIQMHLILPATPVKTVNDKQSSSLTADLGRSLNLQMRYFMPVMVVLISLKLPAAVPLYWITSNLFAILHELFINKQFRNQLPN